ncbi:hypothetical protein JG688_00018205 [Phytophthora aleatoria]|uniref:Uncharacterized protein n=1 Tax=Phytophthora aleatoria TaxID=2496075 RepID=A0A8J5IRR5_9STRA|nr:hypothetical protein JG688_00018205 [Phytophthora aleatoria]
MASCSSVWVPPRSNSSPLVYSYGIRRGEAVTSVVQLQRTLLANVREAISLHERRAHRTCSTVWASRHNYMRRYRCNRRRGAVRYALQVSCFQFGGKACKNYLVLAQSAIFQMFSCS